MKILLLFIYELFYRYVHMRLIHSYADIITSFKLLVKLIFALKR